MCICEYTLKKKDFKPKGYPFSLKFQIIYTLVKNGLKVESKVTNIGKKNAPFGFGFHPFFVIENKEKNQQVNDFLLHVPAKQMVDFDKNTKPTGKFFSVYDEEFIKTKRSFYLKNEDLNKKTIGDIELDNCYYDLIDDENGIVKVELKNSKVENKKITVWQEKKSFPYVQIWF
jgi:aldose 1-epimerase